MRSIVFAAVLAVLSGCASFQGSATEKLVVQAATMKVIEAGSDRVEKAARIIAAADAARVWLDMDGVTLSDLRSAMVERIAAADIEQSDKLLATALVDVVVAELNMRIGDGLISPEKRVRVNTVLSWVVQAAAFYAG